MRKCILLLIICIFLPACENQPTGPGRSTAAPTAVQPSPTAAVLAPTPTMAVLTPTQAPSASPTAQPTATSPALTPSPTAATSATLVQQALSARNGGVPVFDHIVVILFENRDYNEVIVSQDLPNFNHLAGGNVLFTNYFAVAHPSLPNYLALIGGSTFGISSDCPACYINNTSLPDLIEASGRTWKTYQEGMPAPCFTRNSGKYDVNHDPFIYFNPIRTDAARCQRSVVTLTQLNVDLSANQLPNFAFIMPDLCDSSHDCGLTVADAWLGRMVQTLQASPALGQNSMIFIVFDESSSDNRSCCGLPAEAGGRVLAILISPLAKSGFQDATPLSHYSLLKTILLSWGLPALGFTANPATQAVTAPWK